MAHKTYSENFYGKFPEMLMGCNLGKGYDCLCNLISILKKHHYSSSFIFENFD